MPTNAPSDAAQRQIDHMQAQLDRLIDAVPRIETTVNATLEQAKKTNGRVSALEVWQWKAKGVLGVATLIWPLTTALAVWLITGR